MVFCAGALRLVRHGVEGLCSPLEIYTLSAYVSEYCGIVTGLGIAMYAEKITSQ